MENHKSHLIVFDVDGTLTNTHHVASSAYLEAARNLFNLEEADLDWGKYMSSTAIGIAHEIAQNKYRRTAREEEIKNIQKSVLKAVQKTSSLEAIPGSVTLVQHLLDSEDYAVGIATGNFRNVAQYTLAKIGIPEEVPLATTEDHFDRAGIINISEERSRLHFGVQSFKTITYVGDGTWDFRAAQSLGHKFLGIGSCPRMQSLTNGKHVADFSNLELTLQLLETE